MTDAKILIVAYDPAWPARFESERRLLQAVLAPWLAFRHALRADAEVAAAYAALKHRLAHEFPNDREAYTEAKTSFILSTLKE